MTDNHKPNPIENLFVKVESAVDSICEIDVDNATEEQKIGIFGLITEGVGYMDFLAKVSQKDSVQSPKEILVIIQAAENFCSSTQAFVQSSIAHNNEV